MEQLIVNTINVSGWAQWNIDMNAEDLVLELMPLPGATQKQIYGVFFFFASMGISNKTQYRNSQL